MADRPVFTVADLVIDALRRAGIDTLFCLPGVQNDDFFDRLVDARDIRPIVTRHEQGAAYMAVGAAQATGRPAAFAVVPGPGMLNAGAALTSGYWSNARVLAVIGQIPTTAMGRGWGVLHELPDQTAVLRQVTKQAELLVDPASAAAQIQRALDGLVAGRPRPVSIEVPADRWSAPAEPTLTDPSADRPALDLDAIERAATLLAGAERPLIVVGGGAQDAGEAVAALATRLQAPVTTRRMGHGVIPTAHPLFAPLPVGRDLWSEADVVLGIGSRLEWPLIRWGVDPSLTLIKIDVDPDELDRHGATTVGISGDASAACLALLDALDALGAEAGRGRADRTADVAERRRRFEVELSRLRPQLDHLAAIRDVLPDDGVLVEDVTQVGFAAHLGFDFRQPRTFVSSGPAGTLGAGFAMGLGAQAALPDRKVVVVAGDGGFLFTATELATAVQHGIALVTLVFDDGAYGNVRRIQQQRFGPDRTIASTLQNPDFVAFAESFGALGLRATTAEQVRPLLERAFEHDGPAVVVVDSGPMPDPWPFFLQGPVRGRA
ncbi:MAG TPA: thiamine pyrophosphate-dependent enzyme [Acidimicrobiales bacterium]